MLTAVNATNSERAYTEEYARLAAPSHTDNYAGSTPGTYIVRDMIAQNAGEEPRLLFFHNLIDAQDVVDNVLFDIIDKTIPVGVMSAADKRNHGFNRQRQCRVSYMFEADYLAMVGKMQSTVAGTEAKNNSVTSGRITSVKTSEDDVKAPEKIVKTRTRKTKAAAKKASTDGTKKVGDDNAATDELPNTPEQADSPGWGSEG